MPPQAALSLWPLTEASEHPRVATVGQLHLPPAAPRVMLTRLLDMGDKLRLGGEIGKMLLWGGRTTAEGFRGQAVPSGCAEATSRPQAFPQLLRPDPTPGLSLPGVSYRNPLRTVLAPVFGAMAAGCWAPTRRGVQPLEFAILKTFPVVS